MKLVWHSRVPVPGSTTKYYVCACLMETMMINYQLFVFECRTINKAAFNGTVAYGLECSFK